MALLLAAALVCFLLKPIGQGDSYVPLIFVLAVLLISRVTTGYLYGLIASIAAVFGVNFVFTYPYYAFNFTMTGYPITFIDFLKIGAPMMMQTAKTRKRIMPAFISQPPPFSSVRTANR